MSNIGKQPINIPDGVTVDIKQNIVVVKGNKDELFMNYNSDIRRSKDFRGFF